MHMAWRLEKALYSKAQYLIGTPDVGALRPDGAVAHLLHKQPDKDLVETGPCR